MNVLKEVNHNHCVITSYDNAIVKIRFNEDADFKLEDAIEANQTMVNLAEGQSYLSLVDSINVRGQITTEALNHFANHPLTKGVRVAEAIVIDSLHNRILANFYLKFSKSHNPVKVFSKMDPAIKWLLDEFKKQL